MEASVGTSGFSFDAWKGTFYPHDLSSKKWLTYYASRLGSVEINSTFYKLPTERVMATWAAQVPPHFTFALKASRFLTHLLRLQDPAEPINRFWSLATALGKKRGPVLVQLPPDMKKDAGRLSAFLTRLPSGHRAAFEFRHPSWLSDDVYAALEKHDAALVIADTDEVEAPFVPTGSFGYLRMRRARYGPKALDAWAKRILSASRWERAHVFFKHEEAGRGPTLAKKLATLLGT